MTSARPLPVPTFPPYWRKRPPVRLGMVKPSTMSSVVTLPAPFGPRVENPHFLVTSVRRDAGFATRVRLVRARVRYVHGGVRIVECAPSTIDGFLPVDGRARRHDSTARTVLQPQGLWPD